MLAAALALAADKYAVFRLRGKHPLKDTHGFLDATTDEDTICFWFAGEPDLNIGIATGAASGNRWVLDVDPRHGEDKTLAELERKYGRLPPTHEVRTGADGRHLWWRGKNMPHNSAGKLGPGLDIRGDGGYVVAAPSIHPDTHKPYVLVNDMEAAKAPQWLMGLITRPAPPPPHPDDPDDGTIPEGRRNDTFFNLACKMRSYGFSQKAIEAALSADNDRCRPPLSEYEIANIAASSARYEPGPAPQNGHRTIRIEDVLPVALVDITTVEFLMQKIKPREMLLDPILPEQGLIMLYSYRGIGKTFISLGIAMAVASGGAFLGWKAPRPRKVLYVDGEMPAKTLQERIACIVASMQENIPEDNLRWITPDFQSRPMPDLATAEGQSLLEPHLEGRDLVILDNLSCLCRYGKENEGESWLPVQDWALRLRRRGMSVMFDHHANRTFGQRGTSRREDLLDTVITLKHPSDYKPEEGLRCEVVFEKTRAIFGDSVKPFEVALHTREGGAAVWTVSEANREETTLAAQLFDSGASVRKVAKDLGISFRQALRLHALWQSRNNHYGE